METRWRVTRKRPVCPSFPARNFLQARAPDRRPSAPAPAITSGSPTATQRLPRSTRAYGGWRVSTLVEFLDVSKSYDGRYRAVANLNCSVGKGEFLTFLG